MKEVAHELNLRVFGEAGTKMLESEDGGRCRFFRSSCTTFPGRGGFKSRPPDVVQFKWRCGSRRRSSRSTLTGLELQASGPRDSHSPC
jgi:hypothetical protein